MNKTEFVKRFGGVFEHSPWIAERACDANPELGSKVENAADVHDPLCQQFQAASHEERLNVLCAHPDLAGKLALNGELTAESTKEQASAGLDSLTADELALMTNLNEQYQAKFGHPFIIAVMGLSKDDIKVAFQTRVNNSKEVEFETACKQVEKIALLRLNALFA
ncbi:MAG: 2-oxo-4-hydroxy-4-carboxy-5-ureidoimidazoline decarboxylase [Alphaproteobacteria bacterium]